MTAVIDDEDATVTRARHAAERNSVRAESERRADRAAQQQAKAEQLETKAERAEAKQAAQDEKKASKKAKRDARLQRWPWLWHVVNSWDHFKSHNGTQYSAAITYFSFLALFPLLLLAASVTGYVLHSDPHLQKELFDKIGEKIPGDFGATLTKSINTAIKARAGVGIVGLVGVLMGLGWIGNLRRAIDSVAGITTRDRSFIVGKLLNLAVLAGLGLGIVVSLGLTVVGTAVTHEIVRSAGLANVSGITYLIAAAGVVLGLAGDMLIFWWLLVWLPSVDVERGVAFRGILLAAIGFEILKQVGTITIARSSHSPTLGPFASLLAVLIWIELVSRFLLYCVAWMATTRAPAAQPAGGSAGPEDDGESLAVPARGAAWLVGAGAAAGAAAVIAWADRRDRASR